MIPKIYSVLLVEDETAIREGIRDIIPWNDLGFRFAAEAKNGMDALNLQETLNPDLIITDIHMPKMDGLSLIRSLREQGQNVKVVILTGFDEFEYARRALKLNVCDYLLKPVSPSELTELLENVKIELDNRFQDEKHSGEESIILLRRMMMLKLISGTKDREIVDSHLSGDREFQESSWFRTVVYDFDKSNRFIDPDEYRDSFRALNPPGIRSELIPDNTGMLTEIHYGGQREIQTQEIESAIRKKRRKLVEKAEEEASAGIGVTVSKIIEIKKSYDTAKDGLSKRYVRGGGTDYQASVPREAQTDKRTEPIIRFLKAVESDSYNEWQERLDDIVTGLKETDASQEHCQELMTLAVSAMLNTLRKHHIYKDLEDTENSSIIKKIASYKTLENLHFWLSEIVNDITEEMAKQTGSPVFSIAERGRRYIENKYSDSTLSLEDVCDYLGVSISTFSRAFKTYLDTTFSTFLTEIRIQQARCLIKNTDLRNKEIAFRVGFNSPHYFSHVFTKNVGYAPSAYRKKLAVKASFKIGGD